MRHKGYNDVVSSLGNSTAQKLGYNGKELNEELGLNWNDFGWRNYDASLGRWMNIDPFAEKYYPVSPYNYVANSPIVATDPDGRDIRITSTVDDDGNVSINITLTGKVIDLSSGNGFDAKTYAYNLQNRLSKVFSGTHKNADGTSVSVNFNAKITVAESEDDIGEDDHVFGIVDNLDKLDSEDADTPNNVFGRARLDGNIALIEKSYANKTNTSEHETGHLLGLSHTDNTLMDPIVGGNKKLTKEERQEIFNRYMHTRNGHYRNTNRDDLGSGDSKDDFDNALYDWKTKYNRKKRYK
ncbi:RHS repeat-associated protein [Tenacibaculum skagerrakense]|uniref:RHS repeat-associated protein n=2 Tax=Tenacibaculum skagerrakense TaxID=186571 RepID=A0A4R2P213_9FLAO|nr:RHS repeat-associated protein [Tenacibaculum skagerrakense]